MGVSAKQEGQTAQDGDSGWTGREVPGSLGGQVIDEEGRTQDGAERH